MARLTLEMSLLGAMQAARSHYELIRETCNSDWNSTFSPLGRVVAELLSDFYDRDETATTCPKEVLIERGKQKFANSKHAEVLEDFVSGLDGSASVPNLVFDIRQQRRVRIGDELAGLLANRDTTGKIDALISAYQSLGEENASSEEDTFCDVPVGKLFSKHFSQEGTIPFGLRELNRLTNGGIRPGHHVLVYARPELGKSLLCIDQTAHWVERGNRVLYVENEEPIADTTMRVIGRLLRRTREEIRDNPERAQEALARRGYNRFVAVSLSPGNYGTISRLVDKHKPDIVVLNQLRNIDVGDDNRVTALEKAAVGARNLGKSHGVSVLSVTQAGDSAEGKSFLELSDIDFSKTGIPGAIDLAIGIGASEEDKRFGVRHINLPKNKLGGQHGHFSVRFNTQTGVVEEFE